MMRKVAAHRILLPDGRLLTREVVTLSPDGSVLEHHPLQGEEAGVEWYCETYKIQSDIR